MRFCIFAFLALASCKTTPDSLCEHLYAVSDGPGSTKEGREAGIRKCAADWTKRKQQDPKSFECYADCAMSYKHLVDLASCRPRCFPNEQKPKDELDKLEGIIWSEDAGSAAPSFSAAADSLLAAPSAKPSASAPPSASASK